MSIRRSLLALLFFAAALGVVVAPGAEAPQDEHSVTVAVLTPTIEV